MLSLVPPKGSVSPTPSLSSTSIASVSCSTESVTSAVLEILLSSSLSTASLEESTGTGLMSSISTLSATLSSAKSTTSTVSLASTSDAIFFFPPLFRRLPRIAIAKAYMGESSNSSWLSEAGACATFFLMGFLAIFLATVVFFSAPAVCVSPLVFLGALFFLALSLLVSLTAAFLADLAGSSSLTDFLSASLAAGFFATVGLAGSSSLVDFSPVPSFFLSATTDAVAVAVDEAFALAAVAVAVFCLTATFTPPLLDVTPPTTVVFVFFFLADGSALAKNECNVADGFLFVLAASFFFLVALPSPGVATATASEVRLAWALGGGVAGELLLLLLVTFFLVEALPLPLDVPPVFLRMARGVMVTADDLFGMGLT
mmetsp:Transcript_23876/g.51576  ORF Transcript_23876/g.51576 Transcript_23876/m.51576 type:complete len:372 (-) Transcript_23876:339-1454(-)